MKYKINLVCIMHASKVLASNFFSSFLADVTTSTAPTTASTIPYKSLILNFSFKINGANIVFAIKATVPNGATIVAEAKLYAIKLPHSPTIKSTIPIHHVDSSRYLYSSVSFRSLSLQCTYFCKFNAAEINIFPIIAVNIPIQLAYSFISEFH
eukprot:NODE_654_length_5502_cov_0.204516.p5 type:complete len:153 gc:universal NODE_654_length_5502_cov_0.204516:2230-2688(+)